MKICGCILVSYFLKIQEIYEIGKASLLIIILIDSVV